MNFTTDPNVDRALALADDADDRIGDAEALIAAIRELTERINAGHIDSHERADIGGDMLANLDRLNAYAIRVLS